MIDKTDAYTLSNRLLDKLNFGLLHSFEWLPADLEDQLPSIERIERELLVDLVGDEVQQ